MGSLKKRAVLLTILAVLILAGITGTLMLSSSYETDEEAVNAFLPPDSTYLEEDGMIVFETEEAKTGFIFYPSGGVEYSAYIPLLYCLAEEGIFSAVVHMPFNLAVFDINAADRVLEKYPHIEEWYIGGHSLGGAMSADYLKGKGDFSGLILLGAYSASDLSDKDVEVLTLYGSEDKVLNSEKYEANRQNLPADYREVIIEGGCHAYFGMYGAQKGDGTPVISNEEQIVFTAEQITRFIKETC